MEKRWVHISILRGMIKDAESIELEYSLGIREDHPSSITNSHKDYMVISKAQARRIIRNAIGSSRTSYLWVGIQENIITLGVE